MGAGPSAERGAGASPADRRTAARQIQRSLAAWGGGKVHRSPDDAAEEEDKSAPAEAKPETAGATGDDKTEAKPDEVGGAADGDDKTEPKPDGAGGGADDDDKAEAKPDGPASEDKTEATPVAAKRTNVAAKLKGLARKVYRAEAAPGAAPAGGPKQLPQAVESELVTLDLRLLGKLTGDLADPQLAQDLQRVEGEILPNLLREYGPQTAISDVQKTIAKLKEAAGQQGKQQLEDVVTQITGVDPTAVDAPERFGQIKDGPNLIKWRAHPMVAQFGLTELLTKKIPEAVAGKQRELDQNVQVRQHKQTQNFEPSVVPAGEEANLPPHLKAKYDEYKRAKELIKAVIEKITTKRGVLQKIIDFVAGRVIDAGIKVAAHAVCAKLGIPGELAGSIVERVLKEVVAIPIDLLNGALEAARDHNNKAALLGVDSLTHAQATQLADVWNVYPPSNVNDALTQIATQIGATVQPATVRAAITEGARKLPREIATRFLAGDVIDNLTKSFGPKLSEEAQKYYFDYFGGSESIKDLVELGGEVKKLSDESQKLDKAKEEYQAAVSARI